MIEVEQRHADILIKDVGLKVDPQGVVTPGSNVEDINDEELPSDRATRYRASVPRAN